MNKILVLSLFIFLAGCSDKDPNSKPIYGKE